MNARTAAAFVFALLLPVALLQGHAASAHSHRQAIRVLLIDGESGGPWHKWQITTPVLRKELEETGLFAVTVLTAPPHDGDFSGFRPEFSKYQVIVMNYDGPDWPEPLRAEFERYVSAGGGLVIVHAADNAFPHWAAYNQMTGIGGWRDRDEKAGPHWYLSDGKLIADTAAGKAGNHGNRLPFVVTTQAPEHPIMRGLPKTWVHAADELYDSMRGPGKNMTVLATAHSDPANKGSGRDEPMAMVVSYGRGRVFHTTLGHDAAATSCVGFITLLDRGTEWAATGRVTQPVPASFPTPNTISMRVDIAQMDPAFLGGAAPIVAETKPLR